ncbi:mitochondrial ribosomal protein [Elsinoe ampelina]|uniref:Mitochondrial ribosomal protein n=1 Tax=Elsinoe ampelina TaxID=302913 RepID=A0A6A6G4A6_9PEZI|nr:mitochondrial ribosomal protein [Elsinoe ampelina]
MASQPSIRPLASLTQTFSALRPSRPSLRTYATSTTPKYPRPQDFHPGNIYRGHRESSLQFRPLPVPSPLPAIKKTCPDPISAITTSQLSTLDPTGVRTRLFSPLNPERINPGDVVLVRLSNSDPISGVVLNIRRRTPIDTAILLRNQLTRVGVEVWVKVYSPNVTGIEVVQRKEKRARRARLYYMRTPKHDVGSVEGLVRGYLRQRAGLGQQKKGGKGKKR